MPTLPITNSTLSDLAAIGTGKASAQENALGFLAVLANADDSFGSANFDTAAGLSDISAQPDHKNQKDTPTPVAVPIDLPSNIFTSNKPSPQNSPPPADDSGSRQAPVNDNGNQNNSPVNSDAQNAPPATNSSSPKNASATDTQTAQGNAHTGAANADQNLQQDEKQLRDRLHAQLDSIGQILAGIIQSLSSPAAPAAAPVAAATPAGLPGQDADATQPAVAATSSAPAATNAAGAANLSPADEIALLKEIQSLVQQLQQSLPSTGNQATAAAATAPATTATTTDNAASATAAPQASLLAITDKLNGDIAKLATLFGKPSTKIATAGSDAVATPSVDSSDQTNSLSTLGALLKDSIGQVRNQLQQLQTANDSIFQRALAGFRAQVASATASSTDASNKDTNNNAAVINAAAAPAILPAAQNNAGAPTPQIIQVSVNSAATPVIGIEQGSTNNGGSDQSGGGNNQNQQNMAAPMAASIDASQPSGNAGNVSFSRLLNQASPASVMEQVMFNVKTAVSDGSSKIHIQLDPADLGKVDIKLSVAADGKTGVVVTADNKDTLALLQRDTQGLTRALNDAGLTTDSGSLSFNLRGGQDNGQGQGNSQAAMNYQKTQPDEEGEPTISAISRSYVVNLAEGLDIMI